ncbi:Hypothetical predicted protein [Podarcis lilfordi]|uniref:Uncharacterized protein n=1 Tax=Podarcis lilfordi TaxID=74358 RepID=A0AA35JWD9_9SAUR|nr:Hypothetical predicted protein [Podarcis lilfordi]
MEEISDAIKEFSEIHSEGSSSFFYRSHIPGQRNQSTFKPPLPCHQIWELRFARLWKVSIAEYDNKPRVLPFPPDQILDGKSKDGRAMVERRPCSRDSSDFEVEGAEAARVQGPFSANRDAALFC